MFKNFVNDSVLAALNKIMNNQAATVSEVPADNKKKTTKILRPKPNVGVGGFLARQ